MATSVKGLNLDGRGITEDDVRRAMERAPGYRTPEPYPVSQGPPSEPVPAKATLPDPRAGMNRGEAAFANELDARLRRGEILRWDFEPENLRLADRCFLKMDFRVILADGTVVFVDTKGRKGDTWWAEEDARIKLRVAARLHPYPIFVAWPKKGGGWNEERITP